MLYFWTKITIIGNYAFLLWQPGYRMSMINNTRIYCSYSVLLAGYKTDLVSGPFFSFWHTSITVVSGYTVCSTNPSAIHTNIHYIASYTTPTVIVIYTVSVSWLVDERKKQSCPCEISAHAF